MSDYNYIMQVGSVIDQCDTLTGADLTVGGGGTITQEADGWQFSAGAGQNAYLTKNATFNINNKPFIFDLYIEANPGTIGMTIYLSHEVNLGGTVGRVSKSYAPDISYGWNRIFIDNNGGTSLGDWSSLSGTPNFANDWLSFRFRIDGGPKAWKIGKIWNGRRERPCAIITFDDGIDTAYTEGIAYADTLGLKTSQYLIAASLGNASRMTVAQALTAQTAGHELGVHGVDNWTSTSQIKAELSALRALGISGVKTGAYPNGYRASMEFCNSLDSLGFVGVRAINTSGGLNCADKNQPMQIEALPLSSSTSIAAAKAAVDKAIKHGRSVVFYGHGLGAVADTTTWTITDYRALLDYIATKRRAGLIENRTLCDWLESAPTRRRLNAP